GWTSTCQSLCLLCNSLRLKNPVWQSLASAQYASVGMHKIASKFCSQLAQLICEFNTKETKFFLSTLLSAVLMNQLTWVASVAPPENYCCSNNNDGGDDNSSYNHQNNGNNNNKINYYNPTVAQLLELYYGVGTTDSVLSVSGPEGGSGGGEGRGNTHNNNNSSTNNFCNNSQFTKIVVVGDKPEKIALLLRVLSYFVRCSSVESKRSYELLAECGTFKFNGEPPELHDFGRTLMAGVCNAYSPHFVLSDSIFNTICEDVRHPTGEPCLNSQISALLNNSSSSNGSGCLSPTTTNTTTANTTTTNSLCIDHSNLLLMSKNNVVENVGGGGGGIEARKFSIGQLGKGISGSSGVNGVSPSCVPAAAVKATTSPKKHNNASNCCSTTPIMTKSSSLVIFIDMCNLDVRIITSDKCQVDDTRFVCPSDAVTSMLEEFAELYQYKCAPDFLLSFLEDHLVSLLDKSNVLVNLVKTTDINDPLPMEKVSSILGCDCSDLRLILNIAGVYSPDVLATAC
uniref:Folliculin n=1 Tax=Meloidogyne floridensis TaxID=298350 RepID=A0A915P004_9BILA